MNEDSIRLLREINAGCKNGVNSFEQVMEFVKNQELKQVLATCRKEHQLIGDIAHQKLNNCEEDEKDPTSIAKAMMWFTTEIKMIMDDDDSHVAELMIDGCSMGVKSLGRYLNQYKEADQEIRALAGRLMNTEIDLYKDLVRFL